MKKQCTQTIVKGAQGGLGLAVLLWGVRARQPQLDAVHREEQTQGRSVILLAIVCLESENRETELSVDIGQEGSNCRENIRFLAQRECPQVVCIII